MVIPFFSHHHPSTSPLKTHQYPQIAHFIEISILSLSCQAPLGLSSAFTLARFCSIITLIICTCSHISFLSFPQMCRAPSGHKALSHMFLLSKRTHPFSCMCTGGVALNSTSLKSINCLSSTVCLLRVPEVLY